ncbi:hypothetical protein C8R46DRAFT_1186026 [Mycena filopes]|nr:hypothetical protein C8R46DRAFT_1186026 [Mycena filopes]
MNEEPSIASPRTKQYPAKNERTGHRPTVRSLIFQRASNSSSLRSRPSIPTVIFNLRHPIPGTPGVEAEESRVELNARRAQVFSGHEPRMALYSPERNRLQECGSTSYGTTVRARPFSRLSEGSGRVKYHRCIHFTSGKQVSNRAEGPSSEIQTTARPLSRGLNRPPSSAVRARVKYSRWVDFTISTFQPGKFNPIQPPELDPDKSQPSDRSRSRSRLARLTLQAELTSAVPAITIGFTLSLAFDRRVSLVPVARPIYTTVSGTPQSNHHRSSGDKSRPRCEVADGGTDGSMGHGHFDVHRTYG